MAPLKDEDIMSDSVVVESADNPVSAVESTSLAAAVNQKFIYESHNNLSTMPRFPLKYGGDKDLRGSFQCLSDGCTQLIGTVDGGIVKDPSPTLNACLGSLKFDMPHLLDEAHLLMDHVDKSVTSWRASLAQKRADSYLETIQEAINKRDVLDTFLGGLANSIATQLKKGEEEKKSCDDLPVRVSSWRTPSLCFDLEVSEPIHYSRTEHMPLNVRARCIAEIHAKDIDAGTIPSYRACRVRVEQCKQDECSIGSLSGAIGEVLIKVRLSPILGDVKKSSKPTTWGVDKEVGSVRVKEARVFQPNAFPPQPKHAVDLFTSTVHGTKDIVVMLRFKTHTLAEGEDIPEINLELVMAGC